jgi:type II secretory pathway pseudopilin PulG
LIVELLLAFGLSSILLPALLTGFVSAVQGREVYEQRLAATALLREAEEAIRSFRNETWQNISDLDIAKTYYPAFSGTKWTITNGTPPLINGFTRSINVFDVYRDASKNIVAQGAPGAVLDPSTRKFQITVSWPGFITRSVSSSLYITRYLNTFFKEENETVQPLSGSGDWCDPGSHLIAQRDLGGNSLAGNVVAGTDRAFVGTGKTASSHPFYNIPVDNAVYPPNVPQPPYGFYDSAGLKANDVFGESHFAYLAPDNNSAEEAIILDVSGNPTFVKSINISGNKGSSTIFVSNNILYFVALNNNLYAYSLDPSRANPAPLGSVAVGGTPNRMFVVNGYVFLAMNSSSNQLLVFDATDPTHISKVQTFSVNNSQPAVGIFVNNDNSRTYLVTSKASGTTPDFFIINTTNPKTTTPVILNSGFATTGTMNPKGVTVIQNRAIIVGFGSPQYQVLKVDNDNYVQCAAFSGIDDSYNVSSVLVNSHAYSYVVTSNASKAFQIIEGGSGGTGGTGMFESGTLPSPDPGHDVAFNSFTATSDPNLSYKISIKHGVGGSCTGVTFSDSDFTSIVPGPLPLATMGAGYTNPGECLRYRAINSGTSPITFTINFNYSP